MTKEQAAAYVTAQAACAIIELAAMQAANSRAITNGEISMPYGPEQIRELVDKFQISHNAVVSFFLQP